MCGKHRKEFMMARTKRCKYCGAEMDKKAKFCPACGGKNTKPITKRVWFWILLVAVILFLVDNFLSTDYVPIEDREYMAVTVDEMYDELNDNAVNAGEKYSGAFVEVTGILEVIDSDGKYISLAPLNDKYTLDGVQCYITNDEQLETVKGLSRGDKVTVKGKIVNIGEIFGYSLNIDSID